MARARAPPTTQSGRKEKEREKEQKQNDDGRLIQQAPRAPLLLKRRRHAVRDRLQEDRLQWRQLAHLVRDRHQGQQPQDRPHSDLPVRDRRSREKGGRQQEGLLLRLPLVPRLANMWTQQQDYINTHQQQFSFFLPYLPAVRGGERQTTTTATPLQHADNQPKTK